MGKPKARKPKPRKILRDANAFYVRSVLKNGAVLITERARHFNTLAIGVWVRSGSRDESERYAGMAHFLEHMMFKGTSKRTALEISREVDLRGGDFNAMTAREYTCFHITLPVHELAFGLELLAEILKDSIFDPIEIDRERAVILQELAGCEENPEEFLHDLMMERAYPRHPLGRNILGTKTSVGGFGRKEVVEFFRRHYYSRNLILTVAGDIEHRVVREKLGKILGDFKGKPGGAGGGRSAKAPPRFHPGMHALKRNVDQCHLLIGYECYPINHERRVATFLLNAFLGGGMSSALFQSIRELRGLAYTVYSSLSAHRDAGIIGIYVATNKHMVKTCADVIREETRRLIEKPLSSDDLLVVKNSLKAAVYLGSDSMETRMMALAKSELFFDHHRTNEQICNLVDAVDAKLIQAVARDVFSRPPIILVLGDMNLPQLKKAFAG